MRLSLPSLLAYASSLALLGISIPMVTPILASDTDNPDTCQTVKPALLNSADDFIGMGHFQEDCEKNSLAAVASFTQAIRLNPKAEEPYYHRANAYQNAGNYQAAVVDYTEVIRQNTGKLGFSSGAYWNRARAYERLGKKQKAISDLTQLIGVDSRNADQYLFRGNMYRDIGNKERAIADYQVAEKLLQQYLSGSFGNGFQDSRYQEMLEKVRSVLSQLN